jgi:hypothetical protein
MTYCEGAPKKLPSEFGIFRNWGAYFSGQDHIRIAGGLRMYERPCSSMNDLPHEDLQEDVQLAWTISFWTILPLDDRKAKKRRVLIQSNDGLCSYVFIDDTNGTIGMELEALDEREERKGKEKLRRQQITAKTNLSSKTPDWHHIAVVCSEENDQHRISFFLDGKQLQTSDKSSHSIAACSKPIGYIGNSKDLKSPFGSLADLRVYPYALEAKDVLEISELRESAVWEQSLPDKHIHSFLKSEAPDKNQRQPTD